MTYLKQVPGTRATPQNQPIPGRPEMVQNAAGGHGWQLGDWARLRRWLILGSEGATYYATEKALTLQNAECVRRCVAADGPRLVREVVEISQAGRAPKNDPALFALALAAASPDQATRQAAYAALPRVARIGTHLFHFAEFLQKNRGWSRGLRNAVSRWYTDRSVDSLALQLVKYRQRDGWTHRDLLRLAHPTAEGREKDAALRWAVSGREGLGTRTVRRGGKESPSETLYEDLAESLPRLIQGHERLQAAPDAREAAALVAEYRLPRECVPTQFLNDPAVWEALMEGMLPEAMIRSLAKMTAVGYLAPMSEGSRAVIRKLGDVDALRRARLHPIKVLAALKVYAQGHGERGNLTWSPVQPVVNALDEAFYQCFPNVEATGKRWLIAVDISGSMGWESIAGVPGMMPRDVAAAMALVTARTEPEYHLVGFSHTLIDLPISPRQRLDDVVRTMSNLPFGGTDAALAMNWARERKLPVDVFLVITDGETWAGKKNHPSQALQAYRKAMGTPARLAFMATTATDFSLADPKDPGMLDLAGFDTNVPEILRGFALGEF